MSKQISKLFLKLNWERGTFFLFCAKTNPSFLPWECIIATSVHRAECLLIVLLNCFFIACIHVKWPSTFCLRKQKRRLRFFLFPVKMQNFKLSITFKCFFLFVCFYEAVWWCSRNKHRDFTAPHRFLFFFLFFCGFPTASVTRTLINIVPQNLDIYISNITHYHVTEKWALGRCIDIFIV